MPEKKPELLAPAGSIESFHAALDAGADAVYLGMGDFNARQRSTLLTPKTLSYLIPAAQKQGVRVYITLNTLVKDGEIPAFIQQCNTLHDLQPDAVIVQDLGMAAMMQRHFPHLELHGSTQMTLHTLGGFEAAKRLGIRRVVPARELSLRDIYKIRNKTDLEIELFIHGALCYSLSGNCLASSFIGGHSGNRGRCRMVCRRPFTAGRRKGFYFSPKDFQALDYIDEFRTIGIDSLKIEGRMKNSSYVYAVTSAYRAYLDGEKDRAETEAALKGDFGRPKTDFLLSGPQATGIVSAGAPLGTGLSAGKIIGSMGSSYIFEQGEHPLVEGDSLRFQPQNGQEGISCKLLSLKENSSGFSTITLQGIQGEKEGELFIISRKDKREKKWRTTQVSCTPRTLSPHPRVSAKMVMKPLDHPTPKAEKKKLYLRFDDPNWIQHLTPSMGTLICSLHIQGSKQLHPEKIPAGIRKKMILSLPPYIAESETGAWKKRIDSLKKAGFSRWMLGNIGFISFFDLSQDTLYADYSIWTVNRYTQKVLHDMGFSAFMYSPEDDILNLKRTGSSRGIMPVFMRIPVFVSRVRPTVSVQSVVEDSDGTPYGLHQNDGLTQLVSQTPLALTHRIKKLTECGISQFLIDLSFYPPDKKMVDRTVTAVQRSLKLEGDLFNHKRGLK
ncbi:peptidase U32 family protein [Chitinivibrio alkaliphilus]|uniref:U32 family peptidase n=1 Tax=Chitinivibrio alkaliphilus ACht1 TaxID=1313304 RepID=U7DDW3_9BACT|nr:peptidase U32 family protein [Chitinivibrio alkaliphilus]ERP39091.1 U32 family peptidase [Chitinivibrio alkaliphilus ACht1]